jgi:hypothetical protein
VPGSPSPGGRGLGVARSRDLPGRGLRHAVGGRPLDHHDRRRGPVQGRRRGGAYAAAVLGRALFPCPAPQGGPNSRRGQQGRPELGGADLCCVRRLRPAGRHDRVHVRAGRRVVGRPPPGCGRARRCGPAIDGAASAAATRTRVAVLVASRPSGALPPGARSARPAACSVVGIVVRPAGAAVDGPAHLRWNPRHHGRLRGARHGAVRPGGIGTLLCGLATGLGAVHQRRRVERDLGEFVPGPAHCARV